MRQSVHGILLPTGIYMNMPAKLAECITASVHAVTQCGIPGVRCCGEGDAEARPCSGRLVCTSGICAGCGSAGGVCCEGNTCTGIDLNLRYVTSTCNANGWCEVTCGGRGLPCCTVESDDASLYSDYERGYVVDDGCGTETQCLEGVCTGCGEVGEPCCEKSGDDFSGGCTSKSSRCEEETGTCGAQTCGAPGLPCCDYEFGICDVRSECVAGMCETSFCGFARAPCCTDSPSGVGTCDFGRCNDGGTCVRRNAPSPLPLPLGSAPELLGAAISHIQTVYT